VGDGVILGLIFKGFLADEGIVVGVFYYQFITVAFFTIIIITLVIPMEIF